MARGVRLSGLRRRHAWLALSGALALLSVIAAAGARAAFDWQPALVLTQPWRALTAALVHLSPDHLAANLAGLALLALLGREAHCDARDTLAWALAWPVTHLALLLQPALQHYAGLSGVLHAGVAVAAWRLVQRHRGGARAIGVLLLAGLAAKIVWEAPWTGPVHRVPGWAIPIAPLAHATGTLAGLTMAVGLSLWSSLSRGRPAADTSTG